MIDAALTVFRAVIDALLPLIPVELLRVELDQAAVRRANAVADAAEAAKGLR